MATPLPGIRDAHVARNNDLCVLITGSEGEGKSTMAWNIAWELKAAWDWRRDLFLDTQPYMNRAVQLKPGDPIVLDESNDGASTIDWQSPKNKMFRKYMQRCRKYQLVHLLLATHIDELDPYMKRRRGHYWIYMKQPGTGLLHYGRRGQYPGAKTQWIKLGNIHCDPLDDHPEFQAYKEAALDDVRITSDRAKGLYYPDNGDIERARRVIQPILAGEGTPRGRPRKG